MNDLLPGNPASIGKIENSVQSEGRDLIVEYLRRELIGPINGEYEELEGEPPHKRYTMGVLFPKDVNLESELENEEEELRGSIPKDDSEDDPVTLAGQWMPSSMGLSFYFTGEPLINAEVYGARYIKSKDKHGSWQRSPLADVKTPELHLIAIPQNRMRSKTSVLDGTAELHSHWRKLGEGYLITLTLVNAAEGERDEVNGEQCLCQAGLVCRISSGRIQEYPSSDLITADEEEQELQLLYRHKKVYGIGHGCSAEWDTQITLTDAIWTQVMPTAYVPAMTHDLDESPAILSVARLADQAVPLGTLVDELRKFVKLFKGWIGGLDSIHTDIARRHIPARDRIKVRLQEAYDRMSGGISYLAQNPVSQQAFRLANLAMLMQMRHGDKDLAGGRHARNQSLTTEQDYLSLTYKWRPFQLAFQLLTLESVSNEASQNRDDVDLIWFPTGGGKTEAYLAVAAYEIFRRRLSYLDLGAGTAIITRYTLRLLTSQQFQRAARLIAACEYIRRQQPELFGEKPITIGFWAGDNTSPNKFTKASQDLSSLLEHPFPSSQNKFQIDTCPWCGTELLPENKVDDEESYGFKAGNNFFRIFCPTESCEFHDTIPVAVVDEDLYDHPPTFLIATVDKFARLAWVEGGGAFFGKGKTLPPSLIIQDELHLLSGPLGTTVSLYESAIEALMIYNAAKPKILASTATIRNAGRQVKALFGREVRLFPPSGLSSDDSFFAKVDSKNKGRLYVGILSSNHRATTSAVRTAAALLQAVEEIDEITSEEKDAYWTLVMYHLSLRELGKTVSFARDDIPARIKIIASTEDNARSIFDEDVLELTSNLSASEIPASLARMGIQYTNSDSVSILACTNMLSVGVDVPRLGLMMMNGQPKTTSEYIQASSRVGRSKVPGLVITHYSATKPRDRSHYESFLPYHSALYRYVEPASVTPFSLPSRNRALHAAFVILIRHGAGLSRNEDAVNFDVESSYVKDILNILVSQAIKKDNDEALNTRLHLERLVNYWSEATATAKGDKYPFFYESNTRQIKSLLINFGESKPGWPTLHSMRNVDAQCEITVLGEKKNN